MQTNENIWKIAFANLLSWRSISNELVTCVLPWAPIFVLQQMQGVPKWFESVLPVLIALACLGSAAVGVKASLKSSFPAALTLFFGLGLLVFGFNFSGAILLLISAASLIIFYVGFANGMQVAPSRGLEKSPIAADKAVLPKRPIRTDVFIDQTELENTNSNFVATYSGTIHIGNLATVELTGPSPSKGVGKAYWSIGCDSLLYLTKVDVDSAYQNQGFATALVAYLTDTFHLPIVPVGLAGSAHKFWEATYERFPPSILRQSICSSEYAAICREKS